MPSSVGSSPLSSLSSIPSDDEIVPPFLLDATNQASESDASSSDVEEDKSKPQREASPPHEEALADNPDIAFIVMFRARFSDAFPQKLIQFGPQDIERGVVDSTPSPQVEHLLCAILALVLNRKKPIENGHYGRALEEAIQTNKGQWPSVWKGLNPLHGGGSFKSMSPAERLALLRALIMWSLHESEAVNAIIKDAYKQSRQTDDLNVPLSVQPWGKDGLKRRYWLVEGRDDTPFRLYRENNPVLKNGTWWSVAGSIDDLRLVVEKLEKDTAQASKRLANRITMAIPRFEATEEKRRRREYRLARKAAFTRPEPGFSMYEGRTRGKRMRYTYDEDEDEDEDADLSEALGARRSTRNSGAGTPAEPARPTITSSGRQVRSRVGGLYGESLLSGQNTDTRPSPATDASDEPVRASRSGRAGFSGRHVHEDDETSSEDEWDGGDEEEPDEVMHDFGDEDELEEEDDGSDEEMEPKSLVVTLRYGQGRSPSLHHSSKPTVSAPLQPKLAQPAQPPQGMPREPDLAEAKSSVATGSAVNGYLTTSPTNKGMNGFGQSASQATPAPPTNGLLPHNLAPKKQTQLPFQPTPQHVLKAAPLVQPQHNSIIQHKPPQQPEAQQSPQ